MDGSLRREHAARFGAVAATGARYSGHLGHPRRVPGAAFTAPAMPTSCPRGWAAGAAAVRAGAITLLSETTIDSLREGSSAVAGRPAGQGSTTALNVDVVAATVRPVARDTAPALTGSTGSRPAAATLAAAVGGVVQVVCGGVSAGRSWAVRSAWISRNCSAGGTEPGEVRLWRTAAATAAAVTSGRSTAGRVIPPLCPRTTASGNVTQPAPAGTCPSGSAGPAPRQRSGR